MNLRPALFLDRDGVINEEVDYLWTWDRCRFVDGIVSLLRTAHRQGYFVAVVTNQAGIGRGMYTEEDFHRLMERMAEELAKHDVHFDAVYFSPFHPIHGLGDYKRETDCRKPGPGMMLRAAEEHGLDLPRSILVGDRCTDILAGAAAGIGHLYLFGTTESDACEGVSYIPVNSFEAIEKQLLSSPFGAL
ncbi:D-glycero-alpha-D-manno-heptose-1,7-bisphosphate 7-phosphatase [Terriglobus roseus]|uniref:D,D-heptose 1,7-bisphosphate phosphatase n=1 Tax=Terriglobus roseus TaxID=392734 RepID=A0A1H4L847_9BACT|nr:HAD family hydrolase [Terriglobus roseus]SEB66901.1 D-alpha,beta-D-heptose 1,7-bisphosphate phosphatase [Terriglobus roseus]